MPTLDFFRDLTGWTWSWAAADRSGRPAFPGDEAQQWRALTWCSLWDLGDGPQLDVGVQAFAGNAGAKEYGRIKRSLLALLEPAGYRALRARARRGHPPTTLSVVKSIHDLAGARRERARLDQLIFGA